MIDDEKVNAKDQLEGWGGGTWSEPLRGRGSSHLSRGPKKAAGSAPHIDPSWCPLVNAQRDTNVPGLQFHPIPSLGLGCTVVPRPVTERRVHSWPPLISCSRQGRL